jgi:hypothetical protein
MCKAVIALLLAAGLFHIGYAPTGAQNDRAGWRASLPDIRATASLIPGRRPLRLNILKFAESRRTKNFSIEGAPADPSVQARTAFQVMYGDGYVMVDAGMDQQVHRFFGRGAEEPYDVEAAGAVERALAGARLIVVTHERSRGGSHPHVGCAGTCAQNGPDAEPAAEASDDTPDAGDQAHGGDGRAISGGGL